jgi:hypothetical protein
MSTRALEYRPARALRPAEYAKAVEIVRVDGYSPRMIERETAGSPAIYFFHGESDSDIVAETFNIRDSMFAQIGTYFTVRISDAESWAEGWVRHKKLQCCV